VPALGVAIGLGLGLLAGGRLDNLVDIRFRLLPLILLAFVARIALDGALTAGAISDPLRPWLVLAIYAVLTVALLANRSLPGLTAAAMGTAANGLVIVANGGWMPVWQPSLAAAGLDSSAIHSNFHTLLTGPLDVPFLARGGPLVDLVPLPIPLLQSVVSAGDLLLGAGLAFLVFAATVRSPALFPAPAVAAGAQDVGLPVARGTVAAQVPTRGALGHAYVRLASNGAFSAMWLGQVISSLGDRVHQVALVFLVARATNNSPLALGLVFAAITVPGLIVGPFAGALVDRWDRKHVMVASDLIRAAIVCLIPAASILHVALVVALVFGLAAVSSFFRPARAAALPRVVPDEDLLTANSAMWVADTVSDLVGYGLGGLFVAFLGSSLVMAFWLDGASYLASAGLVAAVVIPPFAAPREVAVEVAATMATSGAGVGAGAETAADGATAATAGATAPPERSSILGDMALGWRFLRAETALFTTTAQAAVAEYGLGALMALSPLLVAALAVGTTDAPTAYGLFEMAMGAGLVAGGIVLGGIAERLPKGSSIIVAFTVLGLAVAAMALTGSLAVAIALAVVVGVANVSFVVPSQTLFQQRTPDLMMGLVVAIRLAVVNGVLALAMATSGALAEVFGIRPVLVVCGLVTAAAGLAGLAVRPIRRA
jgi:MFS transporter, DHA3 family, macrolide efflux protein